MLSRVAAGVAVVISMMSGLGLPLPAHAQINIDDLWREAFTGWDGIVFECETPAANLVTRRPPTSFESQVCAAAIEDARFLANALGVPFIGCTDCRALRYVQFIQQYGETLDPLELTLELDVVESPTLIGGAASLEAGAVYARAVDQGLATGPDDPRAQPRGGLLSFWSNDRAFYGPADTLAPAVISLIRTMLTSFFADFALAQ